MRRMIALLSLPVILFCASCQRNIYNGSVNVVRTNGEVERIDVRLPGQGVSLYNRKEADILINHLEAMTNELKMAREQFKVQEPVAPGSK